MSNETCPRCEGPGCHPHVCPLAVRCGLQGEANGCSCCGKCALRCASGDAGAPALRVADKL